MKNTLHFNLDEACTMLGNALNARYPGKRHQVSPIVSIQSLGQGRDEPTVVFEADVTDFPSTSSDKT